MNDSIRLSITEIAGSPHCVASDDGQQVYEQIEREMRQGRKIIVSFRNAQHFTTAFLSAAIGQLYGEFTEENIRNQLTVEDAEPDDLVLLRRVVDTAKRYFSDPEYRKVLDEFFGNEHD
jgi:hypothetical protein